MQHGSLPVILITLMVGVNFGRDACYGPQAPYFTELFPAHIRHSGASLGPLLASIPGGCAPLIATALSGPDNSRVGLVAGAGRPHVAGYGRLRGHISRDPEELIGQLKGPHHQYPDGAVLHLGTMFTPTEDRDAPGGGFTHHDGDLVAITNDRPAPWSTACGRETVAHPGRSGSAT